MSDLDQLVLQWRAERDKYWKRSKENWNKLIVGDLPQEDSIIYSTYEDASSGDTFHFCALQLEAAILKNKQNKG